MPRTTRDESKRDPNGATTFQMSFGSALVFAMRFTILVFVVVGIGGFTFDWDAAKLPGLLVVFVVCSVLFAAAARAMLKIWITAEGIGSRKRPMYWNEITEMDRSTMWFLPGWQVHAVYQESVTVPDAIVAMPEFRATLERLSPPDCKIRQMISGESAS